MIIGKILMFNPRTQIKVVVNYQFKNRWECLGFIEVKHQTIA